MASRGVCFWAYFWPARQQKINSKAAKNSSKTWTPVPSDTWQSTQTTHTSTSGMSTTLLPSLEVQMNPVKQLMAPSEEIQLSLVKRQRTITEQELLPRRLYRITNRLTCVWCN